MANRIQARAVSLLLGICCLLNIGCRDKKPVEIEETAVGFRKEGMLQLYPSGGAGAVPFDIEVADNEYEIQTGMMYRDQLGANQGMLFVFPDARGRSFYMKNTRIPLDIIYIGADSTIVSIQKNAQPMNESSLPSEGPARFVLEINGGLSDELGIQAGDKVSFTTF